MGVFNQEPELSLYTAPTLFAVPDNNENVGLIVFVGIATVIVEVAVLVAVVDPPEFVAVILTLMVCPLSSDVIV